MSSERPKVIEAQEFRVVDAEGNLRAALGLGKDGSPYLGLYDAAGDVLWQAP